MTADQSAMSVFDRPNRDLDGLIAAVKPLEPGLLASPVPSAVASLDGRFLLANPGYCRLLARDLAELRALNVEDVTHPDDVARDRCALRAVARGQLDEHRISKRYVRPDGSTVEAFTQVGPVHDFANKPLALLAHVLDMAELPVERARPLGQERSFRLLFAANPQPMWIFDLDTLRFLEVNDAACEHFGAARSDLLGRTVADVRLVEDLPALHAQLACARTAHGRGVPQRHLRADGRVVEVEVITHEIVFDGRDAVLGVAHDVTDRNRLERQLSHHALHDPISGLANRALFLDRLSQMLAAAAGRTGMLCVLYLDLDSFQLVNESLGHQAGDQVIGILGARLAERLPGNATAGSIAGDEIAVCAPSIPDAAAAIHLAHSVQMIVSEPIHVQETALNITASVGIALANEGGGEAAALVRDAALATVQAKHRGPGEVAVFEDQVRAASRRRGLSARHELRGAIESAQIETHYQPVVSLTDGAIVAVEALARWAHPERGLLAPAEFLPLAEETGLIVALGRVMLEQACHEATFWPGTTGDGRPPIVSVNLSGRQLQEERLRGLVNQTLQRTGLEPSRLALEITETMVVEHGEALVAELASIRQFGIHVALDDFGTGYASLARLDELPFNVLKIDRSFVTGMPADIRHRKIVPGVIALAHALELHVVAEGVETEREAAEVVSLGGKYAQGYHFHRPMPAERLRALLAEHGVGHPGARN